MRDRHRAALLQRAELRKSSEVKVWLQCARDAHAAGRIEAAHHAFEQAAALDATPFARYVYAGHLADGGRIEPAIRELEAAWDQARWIASPVWRARCCHAISELYRGLGRHDLADRYRQWGLRADLDGGGPAAVVEWLRDRFAHALTTGELDAAERWLAAIERLVTRDSDDYAQVLIQRGAVQIRLGRWSRGLQDFAAAVRLCRRRHDRPGCAQALQNLGHVLQAQGKWRQARACFRRSACLHRQLGALEAARRAEAFARESLRWLAVSTGDPSRN